MSGETVDKAESMYGGWEALEGYEEFIAEASSELEAIADTILSELSPTTLVESYVHPNGFLVNTLRSDSEGQLRLHMWPTGRIDDLTPHSHNWHMASRVLAGSYVEYLPSVHFDPNSLHELIVPRYNAERVQTGFEETGRRVRFELGEPYTYKKGENHYLPAGAFHVSPLPQDFPIITLVRTSPQLYDNPSFVKRTTHVAEQMTLTGARRHPTPTEVINVWSQIQAFMHASE